MNGRVAVLGAGIGGLTAAHELVDRGYDVTMYEQADRPGGKARSFPGPAPGDGRALPGEHGFRFFPGFYTNVVETMDRIPTPTGTAADHLVETEAGLAASVGEPPEEFAVQPPSSLDEWRVALRSLFGGTRVPAAETAHFTGRLLTFLTSSRARRVGEFEATPWWEFIDAPAMSPAYRTMLGDGLTRTLVAMRPQVSSTRTIGRIYLQLLRSRLDDSIPSNRILDGPSSEVWLDPWVAHLESLGVEVRTNARVEAVRADDRAVTGVEVVDDGTERTITADYYVLALPVDGVVELRTPELERVAPSLSDVHELRTGWMNGVQFYLAEDVPVVRGHAAYYDSPWALTSISQAQFWDEDVSERADGSVSGVLSVIVSEWDEPGIRYGKPASDCTETEFVEEVWAQLQAHFESADVRLADDDRVDYFVDPTVEFGPDGVVANDSELLINTAGSLQHRPRAGTAARNLVLASTYVRTDTDLASMESANEAGRRAVNEILDRDSYHGRRCRVWELEWPGALEPLRQQDAVAYELGLPHPLDAGGTVAASTRSVGRSLTGLFRRG